MNPLPTARSLLAGLILVGSVACSSDPSRPSLQETLDRTVEELEVDGASVAVIDAEGDVVVVSSGVAYRGDVPVDERTRFAIASITKSFTTVVALRLAERGVVDLDAPLELDGLDAGTTLRDLLGHTAGLPYPASLTGRSWTPSAFEAAVGADAAPCERPCFNYSDLGFVGAGLALEQAAGRPFAELLQAEVLDPLGLDRTAIVEPERQPGDIAFLDRHDDPEPVDGLAAVPQRTWAAGALVTSAGELARFGRALFDGDLLQPASLAEMQDVERSAGLPCGDRCSTPYGLGLHPARIGGHDAWGHTGSSGAALFHFPEEDTTVAVLTTRRDSGDAILHSIMNAVPGIEERADIYAIPAGGGDAQPVITHPLLDGGPSWSPDGERIAFGSVRDGNSELYVADADGTDVRRLTDEPADDGAARWSPDGTSIVFGSRRQGSLDIYLLTVESDEVVRLTDDPIDEELPVVSPDGERIAFSTASTSGDGDIVVIDIDGTNRRVFRGPDEDWGPTWSPDGASIAFTRRGEGIWVMDADGSDERQLSSPDAPDRWPSWGPTGRIAFVFGGDLWTMADDGSDRRRVTETAEEEFLPSWSPDGGSLVYTRQ